jgi:RNA polymerase sigma-70 factor, ECF subfamily
VTAQRADNLVLSEIAGSSEERELAIAFKRGDDRAYDAIHERYEARVYSVCRRMLGDPNDAEEAVQEAFIRVYQSLPRFNGRYRLGAWIVRIATNVCLDQLRSRARHPSDPAPLEVLDLEPGGPIEDSDPELLFLRRAEGRRVRRVLASLPPLHRAAIVLRDFEGISYADIADTLGISECQVKALLHRARKGFRRSWTAGAASIFLPTSLLRRLFGKVDLQNPGPSSTPQLTVASQTAESAMSIGQQFAFTASQAAASCGGMIHQCSTFVADKTVPVVAAVVVGTAATVGAVATAPGDDKPAAPPAAATAQAVSEDIALPVVKEQPEVLAEILDKDEETTAEEAPPDPVAEAPVPPIEQVPAEPVPSPEAPPPVDEGGEPEPGDGTPGPAPETPPLPAEPQEFSFSFGTSLAANGPPCACLADVVDESSFVSVNEQGIRRLDHVITGSADAAGTPSYGLRFHHASRRGNDHAMDFSLWTEQGAYKYNASGQLTERTETEWGGWLYRYEGTYQIYSRPTMIESMPEQGTYVAEVEVSWRQARVVATRVYLDETF